MSTNVVDVLNVEKAKKEKRTNRRVDRMRLKEEKLKLKENKRLEKEEDKKFDEYLRKIKQEKLLEETIKPKKPVKEEIIKDDSSKYDNYLNELKRTTRNANIVEEKSTDNEKRHPFLNFLIGLLSIFLIVITVDYMSYNSITNYKDLPTLINSILLTSLVLFYLLSILFKNNGARKFFEILSMLSIIGFMAYNLFII